MNPTLASLCEYFHNLGLWNGLAPEQVARWLDNFEQGELAHAEALIESLVYVNDEMAERLFTSAFHALSDRVAGGGSYADRVARWQRFRDDMLVTYVTGEQPNPSDSGFTFARLARRNWLVEEQRILSPEDALRHQITNSATPMIFVDDFCGSGEQFLKTWRRQVVVGIGKQSFASASASGRLGEAFYCLPVITEYALVRLRREAPAVSVQAAHVLPTQYGAQHPDTILFPEHLRSSKDQFLASATGRAFGPMASPLGFHDLGLAVAFEDSTPDACLPLLWEEAVNWSPLVPRR